MTPDFGAWYVPQTLFAGSVIGLTIKEKDALIREDRMRVIGPYEEMRLINPQ
jgi:hypothetical protein